MQQGHGFPRWQQNFSSDGRENYTGKRHNSPRNQWRETRPRFYQQHQQWNGGMNGQRANQQFRNDSQMRGKSFGRNEQGNIRPQHQNEFDFQPLHISQQVPQLPFQNAATHGGRQHGGNIPFQNTYASINMQNHGQELQTTDARQQANMDQNQFPRAMHPPPFAPHFPPPMQNLPFSPPPMPLPWGSLMPLTDLRTERKQDNVQPSEAFNEDDKKLIQDWLCQRNVKKNAEEEDVKSGQDVKINVAKKMITEYLTGIKELVEYKNYLSQNLQANEQDWSQIEEKTGKIRERLEYLQSMLFQKHYMEELRSKMKIRQKKRERQRKLRKSLASAKQEKLRKAVVWDQKIDEWRHKIISDIHSKKLTDSLKSEAGKSLVEVRKKKTESSKYLEKLNSLKELRSIRRETALQRGIFIFGKEDEKFENKIDGLVKLMRSRIDDYKDEEKTLLVMLEEEKEQIQREDDKKRKRLMKNEHVRLFGYDPLVECRRYWSQAEENPISLVQVRRLWDVHVVPDSIPGADRVPVGWVEPEPGQNPSWDKYLHKKKIDIS